MRASAPLQPDGTHGFRNGLRHRASGFGRVRRLWGLLGDPNHCRPQQTVVQHVTGLQHLDDDTAGLAGPLGLEDRLMQIVVETLALRIDAPEAMPLEYRKQLALGRLDTGDEAAR